MLSDVQGQEVGVAVLRNFVSGKVQSPLLLVGDEGVGRRYSVLEAIKEIVAKDRGEKSSEVKQVALGVHPDVMVVTPVAGKEIGVEVARELVDRAQNYPSASPYRFFLVDGADRMTTAAANAVLKTLEERPARSRFILLAESYERVLSTIRSRCVRVNYCRLPESFIFAKLSAIEPDPDRAFVYSRLGEGSVGRAVRLWGSNQLTLRDRVWTVLTFGLEGDVSSMFSVLDELKEDLELPLRLLRLLVHDLLVVGSNPDRVFNTDMLDALRKTHSKAGAQVWMQLRANLKQVEERDGASYINLPFHLKAALLSAFSV